MEHIPYSYDSYTINNSEETIPDYYRTYYLPHCNSNPIIKDLEDNKYKILSVNRHVHILFNYFNITCNVSRYEDGRYEELIAVYATYVKCMKYIHKLNIEEANICIFGPASCEDVWVKKKYDGVGKIKFYSINLIQGNSKRLPDEDCMLSAKKEGKKIVYSPGRVLKKLVKNNYCYIFDNIHYIKNECISSDVVKCMSNYINRGGIYIEYDEYKISKLKEKNKTNKLLKEYNFNKIIFSSDTLTDNSNINSILKCFGIIDNKVVYGGRGIGAVKNYEELRKFIIVSRGFNNITREIESDVLDYNSDLLSLESEDLQRMFSNNLLNILTLEIFTKVWIPLLFSHTYKDKDDYKVNIVNSFYKLKYSLKEDKKIFKHVQDPNTSVLTNFSKEIDSLEVASLPIIEGIVRDYLEEGKKVLVSLNRNRSIEILSKAVKDIEHIVITSKNDDIEDFPLVISTIKSVYCMENIHNRIVISSSIPSAIDSTRLIYPLSGDEEVNVIFVNIIPKNIKEDDVISIKNLTDNVPIYFSTVFNNISKAEVLSRFNFNNKSYTNRNIDLNYIEDVTYPKNKKLLSKYRNIRNKYIK